MKTPLISIIIPVYNVEKYLSECLDSVIAQTYQNWEAICVNDGSPDNCGAILDQYASTDPRIKVIHKENRGVSDTRNVGLKQAIGEYITFLDSDDMLYPQFLEYMLNTIQKDNSDIVCCDKLKGKKHIKYTPITYSTVKSKIIKEPLKHKFKKKHPKISVSVWGKLYKKEAIKDLFFYTDMKVAAEDFLFIIQTLNQIKKISYIKEKMIYYRLNEESITHKSITSEYFNNHFVLIKRICETITDIKTFNLFRKNILPSILKKQFNKYKNTDNKHKDKIKDTFIKELTYMKYNKLISLFTVGLEKYIAYEKLLKESSAKLSIIIPTMQRNKEILDLLVKQLVEDCVIDEIIIIDNSTKGYKYNSNKVSVYIPKQNLYVNPSWNLGVSLAKNDYIGILNDDILLPANLCNQILNFIKNNTRIGLVGVESKKVINNKLRDFNNYPTVQNQLKYKKIKDLHYPNNTYWGTAIFGARNHFYKIPEEMLIYCGDDYLLKKNNENRTNYAFYNTEIYHCHSLTSCSKEFNSIKNNDMKIIETIYPEYKKIRRKCHIIQKIFSIKNSQRKTHKIITVLGLKIKLKRRK